MHFLCDFHREQLSLHPAAASRRWEEWMELGGERFRAGDWPRALQWLGNAYELAQLALAREHRDFAAGDLTGFDRMMIAGHYLAECLQRLQRSQEEWEVLLAVHRGLLQALEDESVARSIRSRLRYNLAISLQLLDRRCSRERNLATFARLYRQTQARLQSCAGAVLH